MRVVTDKKPTKVIYRIVDSLDEAFPFALHDDAGNPIQIDRNPHRLADFALENGADVVRHDYDIRDWEES